MTKDKKWWVARVRHKTLPFSVKGIVCTVMAPGELPEDDEHMQFLAPVLEEQLLLDAEPRRLLESGAMGRRAWSRTCCDPIHHMMKDSDHKLEGVLLEEYSPYCLIEFDAPLVDATARGDEIEGYKERILDGRPFFVMGRDPNRKDKAVKTYSRREELLGSGFSCRNVGGVYVEDDDGDGCEHSLFYLWPTAGRMKCRKDARKRERRSAEEKLKADAKNLGLVFKDGNPLNVAPKNVAISEKIDKKSRGVIGLVERGDDAASEKISGFLKDVLCVCAAKRLAGSRKASLRVILGSIPVHPAAHAMLLDPGFPTRTEIQRAVRRLRAEPAGWRENRRLDKDGKWSGVCGRHLLKYVETALNGARSREAERKRKKWKKWKPDRLPVKVGDTYVSVPAFRRLVAAVRQLPEDEAGWFQRVVVASVLEQRKEELDRYVSNVKTYLKAREEVDG